ncbi:MAG: hypothetical protein WDW38_003186 [Sanguina aurantia]
MPAVLLPRLRGEDGTRDIFGPNTLPITPPVALLAIMWETLHDPILILLLVAAALSIGLGAGLASGRANLDWIDGVAIFAAVAIVTVVGAGNDYLKDQQFRKMGAAKDVIPTKVVRGGRQVLVPSTEVVVGDILMMDTGDKVIADCIIIESFGLVVDEASLTGEAEGIPKDREQDPWVRSGTQVSEGSGKAMTLMMVSEEGDDSTPLQLKLEDVAGAVGKLGVGVAVACFLALFIKWLVVNHGFPIAQVNNNGPVQFFLYAITIIVVAVPEGLPLAVTISLAYSMKKMMLDNNFVRVLAACETMGGATAICSDKTGTLTENRMTVVEGWFAGHMLDHTPTFDELPPDLMNEIKLNIALSSKAFLIDQPNGSVEFVGNRTECALLMLLRVWKMDYAEVRKAWAARVVGVYGFSSLKKMSSVLVRHGEAAPVQQGRSGVGALDIVTEMAKRGLRCIALSHTDADLVEGERPSNFRRGAEEVDKDLTAMAILGIKDPVRREVPEAVRVCQQAGILVRMVTGDNIHTARCIARECGILGEGHLALEGPSFRAMSHMELIPLLPRLRVLARSSPEDKLKFVTLLKSQAADVGLAMGIAGTEVAKEAADIIIMDDNFSSIVKAVLWGRSVFNNIRKFLQFQLTVNMAALIVSFVGAVVGGHEPLNVLQLLWVNLIMDTMGALALATDDPHPRLLLDKPHGHTQPLITRCMWWHIAVQSFYQLFWMFFCLYALPLTIGRYAITTSDTFYRGSGLTNQLQGHFSYNTSDAVVGNVTRVGFNTSAYVANVVSYCGFPAGGQFVVTSSPQCWLYRDIWSGVTPAQQVPTDMRLAISTTVTDDYKRPLSVLFNAFIMCQICNEINSRRINDEYNVFENFLANPIFLSVIGISGVLQFLIMEFLGLFFKVIPLDYKEWLATIAIGLGAFPVSLITRSVRRNWHLWRIGRTNRVYNSGIALPPTRNARTMSRDRAVLVHQTSSRQTSDRRSTTGGGFTGRIFYPCVRPDSFWARPWSLPWIGSWMEGVRHSRGYPHFLFYWAKKTVKTRVLKEALSAVAWMMGTCTRMDYVTHNAPVKQTCSKMPIILFSHGLGGTRNSYSRLCSEWASQGFMVVSMEHTDGSGSAVRVPYLAADGTTIRTKWLYYDGISKDTHVVKIAHRVRELQSCREVLEALDAGKVPGVTWASGALEQFQDRLDTTRVTAAGHSYGGATVAALVATDPKFGCGVAMDPWWGALGEASPARTAWQTSSPLLILGSHAWNTPHALTGKLSCDGEAQQQVMEAAAVRARTVSDAVPCSAGDARVAEGAAAAAAVVATTTGGGALLCVITNSTHQSYDDLLIIFWGGVFRPVLKLINFKSALPPAKALALMSWSVQHFVETHLQSDHRQHTSSESLGTPKPITNHSLPGKPVLLDVAGEQDLKVRIQTDLVQLIRSKGTSPEPDPDIILDSQPCCIVAAEQLGVEVGEWGAVRPLPLLQHHLPTYRRVIGEEDMSILRMVD